VLAEDASAQVDFLIFLQVEGLRAEKLVHAQSAGRSNGVACGKASNGRAECVFFLIQVWSLEVEFAEFGSVCESSAHVEPLFAVFAFSCLAGAVS